MKINNIFLALLFLSNPVFGQLQDLDKIENSPYDPAKDKKAVVDDAKPSEKLSDAWPIKRRKTQVSTEPGYIATPAAANIPGIGFTYGILGSYFNILGSEADFLAFRFWGDLSGYGVGFVDIPLFIPGLVFTTWGNSFDKLGIDVYERGMESDPDNMRRLVSSNFNVIYGQISYRLFEKRLQFHYSLNRQQITSDEILDKDGNKVADLDQDESEVFNRSYGAIFDLTDDKADPRKGVTLEAQIYDPPKTGSSSSDTQIHDYNILAYVPVGKFSTIVFNAYRSDAYVTKKGETDIDVLRANSDVDCSLISGEDQINACNDQLEKSISDELSRNKYGTAAALGGTQRMRSFSTNRFYAAHAMSFGTELRLNLTEEFTPFNYIVAGGVRTGIQLAAFYEVGSVADIESDLFKDKVYSIGVGGRLLVASGFVIRLDFAYGEEGIQPTLIFNYPWNVF